MSPNLTADLVTFTGEIHFCAVFALKKNARNSEIKSENQFLNKCSFVHRVAVQILRQASIIITLKQNIFGTKYSRMDQVKFVEDNL